MRIAICDDEREAREMLARQVRELEPEADVRLYASGEELLAEAVPPDILLLDIQMPGRDGMRTARLLREKGWRGAVIFITALEEYVFEAFDVGAFHYLVKPFAAQKLRAVLQQAIQQYERQSARPAENRSLLVRAGGVHTRVCVNDVVYAEVFNRKVIIHKLDGDIEYYGKISALQEQAGADFFRPHRAYLIHFKYVVRYDASTIYLERGKALMAKKNYPAFVQAYHRYLLREGGGHV